jgi:phage terminase small subunit
MADEKSKEPRKLTAKQERFCQEYVIDLNATQAAIRAKYSERTAEVIGWQLLQIPLVSERVSQLKAAQLKRLGLEADTILRELLSIATADATEAFDDMGGLKPFREWPAGLKKSLSSLEVSELFAGQGDGRTAIGLLKKVRFWDKPRSLEMLGKHLKLFAERMELTGKDGGAIETKDASALPDEKLEERLAALMAKRGVQLPPKDGAE